MTCLVQKETLSSMQMLSKRRKVTLLRKKILTNNIFGWVWGKMHNSHNVVNCMQFKISMGRDVKRVGDEKLNFILYIWFVGFLKNFLKLCCDRLFITLKESHPLDEYSKYS